MSVRIQGITARDTYHTVAPDGRARLHVELFTGDREHTVARAVYLIGQGNAAAIVAARVAYHLKKGRRVTVHGAGLAIVNGNLVVAGCERVTPDDAVALHVIEGATA